MASSIRRRRWAALAAVAVACLNVRTTIAQTFGVEAHNTLMPASGAMAGASLARPQDSVSAINGNPATLTQYRGTTFAFSGAWAEPTFNLEQTGNIPVTGPPRIEPFAARSEAPGTPLGNIGVTQQLDAFGMPATFGLGFVSTSGGFVDFRQVPESYGTNSGMAIFNMPAAVGVEVAEYLSLGASVAMGIAFFDGPFVGASGMTPDYALRGAVGSDLALTEFTTLGAYYQTEESFQFDNAVIINPGPGQTNFDVQMDLPQNVGLGVANDRLMDGRLLLAVDALYKLWDEADMYRAIYDNQWVLQFGAQYSLGRCRLRAGYAWAEDPIGTLPDVEIGGVVQPGGIPAAQYSQALMAITGEHRLTGGVGFADVLPGVDLDFMAGGMFDDSQVLGPFTSTTISSYWVGTGLTWRFGQPTSAR